jgi:hypothetical protein
MIEPREYTLDFLRNGKEFTADVGSRRFTSTALSTPLNGGKMTPA